MPGDPHDLPTLPPTSSPTSGHLDAPEPAALLFSASGASSGRPGLFSHFRSHSKHHLLGGVGRDPAPAPTPTGNPTAVWSRVSGGTYMSARGCCFPGQNPVTSSGLSANPPPQSRSSVRYLGALRAISGTEEGTRCQLWGTLPREAPAQRIGSWQPPSGHVAPFALPPRTTHGSCFQ